MTKTTSVSDQPARMDHTTFSVIKPRVLRQEVLDALRNAILNREITPGVRLLEASVATQMGVSRAPVREAIRQLEQEGLVEFVPHRGAVVLGLPDDEIDTIYELRATIEARAMAAVSVMLTPEQDAQLADLIEQMRLPLANDDIEALSELDWQLHGLILDLSRFTLLRRTWSSLAGLVRLRSYQALGRPGAASDYFKSTAIASHQALLDALRTGDPKVASKAGRDHVLEVPKILAGAAKTEATGPAKVTGTAKKATKGPSTKRAEQRSRR